MTLEQRYKLQEYLSFLIYDIGNIPADVEVRIKFLTTTATTFDDIKKLYHILPQEDIETVETIQVCFINLTGDLSENKSDIEKASELISKLITKYN